MTDEERDARIRRHGITTGDDLRTAIARLVEYNWDKEVRDYETERDGSDNPDTDTEYHIFHVICALDAWANDLPHAGAAACAYGGEDARPGGRR